MTEPSSTRTVVWGHSQGGHAALWTGIIARYAPEVEIVGIAAIANGEHQNILAMNIAVDKQLGPYLALAYSRLSDVRFDDAIRPEALAAAAAGVSPRISSWKSNHLANWRVIRWSRVGDGNEQSADAQSVKTPRTAIAAPVLIAQGLSDVTNARPEQRVDERCGAGQRLSTGRCGFGSARSSFPARHSNNPFSRGLQRALPIATKPAAVSKKI
jgi:pimeloyl-ACP methyl ester carboxylesterase